MTARSTKNSRRRGVALEGAILEAAWAELNELGYGSMTLESVAKRSGTSRPVLARRWPTRMKLATAAMGRYFARNPILVPDMGSVRDELRLLLRLVSDRARPDLIRLVFDMSRDLADANSSLHNLRGELSDGEPMRSILKRAVDRGEIDAQRLTPRYIALPADLARNEILMTLQPLSEKVIREIVDDVFLPLVRGSQARSPLSHSSSHRATLQKASPLGSTIRSPKG
jgi:AcrR family transcriptional regulator